MVVEGGAYVILLDGQGAFSQTRACRGTIYQDGIWRN